MLSAIHIRNCMETFHAKHLTDKQMAELNPIIRQALFGVFTLLDDDEQRDGAMEYWVSMIPNYWEVPYELYGNACGPAQPESNV